MVELLMCCIECICNKNKNMKINILEFCFRGKLNLFVEIWIFFYIGVMVYYVDFLKVVFGISFVINNRYFVKV